VHHPRRRIPIIPVPAIDPDQTRELEQLLVVPPRPRDPPCSRGCCLECPALATRSIGAAPSNAVRDRKTPSAHPRTDLAKSPFTSHVLQGIAKRYSPESTLAQARLSKHASHKSQPATSPIADIEARRSRERATALTFRILLHRLLQQRTVLRSWTIWAVCRGSSNDPGGAAAENGSFGRGQANFGVPIAKQA